MFRFLTKIFLACVGLVFCAKFSFAQVLDTLEEVSVSGSKLVSTDTRVNKYAPGQQVHTIDSTILKQYQLQNVANLLSQRVPVFIKSYGLNGLATLNFRGASAAQSQVFWNGVPIQNAALGIADVSTLPIALIHKLHVVYGGSSALWGSGNVGGALLLEETSPLFDSVLKTMTSITLGAGSFGQYMLGANFSLLSKKWSVTSKVFVQNAKNDFTYKDEQGTTRTNTNAALKSLAVLTTVAYKLNKTADLSLHAWYQNYHREIPPALFETQSQKKRNDESLKLLLEFKNEKYGKHLYSKLAFIKDDFRYKDALIGQDNANSSYQIFAELGLNKRLGKRQEIFVFTPLQVSFMKVNTQLKKQEKYALAIAYHYKDLQQKFDGAINLRGEVFNGRVFFLPGINASYQLARWIKLRANIQRSYRTPTLNELYYQPGGNEQLNPEKGWSEDVGYSIHFKPMKRLTIDHDIALYNRVIEDWVIWFGGAIWTPHNIAKVHSRGVELSYLFSYTLNKKWKVDLGLNGAYTRATTLSSYIPNDGSIGKQIPYTPMFITQLNAGVTYRNVSLRYNFVYNGYRYINADETGLLPAYQISNIHLSYQCVLRKKAFQFMLQCNNIFNEQYTVVASRSMPSINWIGGITMKF